MHPISLNPRGENCRVISANHNLRSWNNVRYMKYGAGLSDNFGKPQGRKSAHNILSWGLTPNIAREYGSYHHVKAFTIL